MKKAAFEIAVRKNISQNEIRESLLDNEFMSDLTFIIENENTSFKAHKMFLMTASPIFQRILTNNNKPQLSIKLNQISKSTLLEICRYAYTEDVKFTDENKFDILFAAMKFEMKYLIEKTIEIICKQLSEKTVFQTLESNKKFNNLKINLKCFEFIEKNHQKCFESSEFLKISEDLLRILLETCKIPGKSTAVAIINWTRANNFDDLVELMSLINLKESSDNHESDDESVASSKISESSKNPRRGRRQRRYGRHSKEYSRNPTQNSSYSVDKFHVPIANVKMAQADLKCLKLIGNIMRKNYKYANLDISAKVDNVFLHALTFVYDLRTTDKEFDIAVYHVDNNVRKTLYLDSFIMDDSTNPLTGYKFGKEIKILSNQKIWIKIEFPKSEYRLTFDKFGEYQQYGGCELMLRQESEYNSYAQIISAVHFNVR